MQTMMINAPMSAAFPAQSKATGGEGGLFETLLGGTAFQEGSENGLSAEFFAAGEKPQFGQAALPGEGAELLSADQPEGDPQTDSLLTPFLEQAPPQEELPASEELPVVAVESLEIVEALPAIEGDAPESAPSKGQEGPSVLPPAVALPAALQEAGPAEDEVSGVSESRFEALLRGPAVPRQPRIPVAEPLRRSRSERGEGEGRRMKADGVDGLTRSMAEVRPAEGEGSEAKLNQVLFAEPETKADLAASGAKVQAPAPEGASPVQGGSIAASSPASATGAAPQQAATLRLPSGYVLPESQVVDQVVGRLSVKKGGEASSLKMKLHPEELGEVRLELAVDKDRVKAQLVTQSQQVQEVLEKHLPRLREALEQQGMKLEDVQVSVDSRQNDGGRGLFQEQQDRSTPFRFAAPSGSGELSTAELDELPSARPETMSGLSIRI